MKMNRQKKTGNWIIALCSLLTISACEFEPVRLADPNENLRPLAAFLQNNYEYSLLYAAVVHSGMEEELNDEGPFTLLAPTDQAFNELGILNTAQIYSMDPDSLREVLGYHILNERFWPDSLPGNMLGLTYPTRSGDTVHVNTGSGQYVSAVYVNGATIHLTQRNVLMTNGVMHSIDKVLKYKDVTLQQFLAQRPEYRVFVAGLRKFGLWEQLGGEGPLTVIAPTDEAFSGRGVTLADIEAMDASEYGRRLFGCYIFPVRFFGRDFISSTINLGIGYYLGSPLRLPVPGDTTFAYGIGRRTPPMELFLDIHPADMSGQTPVISKIEFSRNLADLDFKVRNGVVHQTHNILLHPAQAVIQ